MGVYRHKCLEALQRVVKITQAMGKGPRCHLSHINQRLWQNLDLHSSMGSEKSPPEKAHPEYCFQRPGTSHPNQSGQVNSWSETCRLQWFSQIILIPWEIMQLCHFTLDWSFPLPIIEQSLAGITAPTLEILAIPVHFKEVHLSDVCGKS